MRLKADHENAEHDKRTGGAKVIDLRPKWKQGPLGAGLPFVMPFGSYKGCTLEYVPPDYLAWFLTIPNLYYDTREAINSFLLLKEAGVVTSVPRAGATALGAHPESSPDIPSPPWLA